MLGRGALRPLRPALGILVAGALLLGGCGGSSGDSGWSAAVPDGWKNATTRINARSNTEFQAVYEGPKDGDVRASISVARVPAAAGDTLASITHAGRANLEKAYGKAAAVTVPVDTHVAGAPAMRFDYEAEGGQVRQVGRCTRDISTSSPSPPRGRRGAGACRRSTGCSAPGAGSES